MSVKDDRELARKIEIEPIYKELAERVTGADFYYTPRIIKKFANLEEARIIRELPAPTKEIAKKLSLDDEKVEKTIKELIKKGCLLKTKKGIKLFGSMAPVSDFGCANPDYDEVFGEEFFEMVAQWNIEFSSEFAKAMVDSQLEGNPMARVVPRWKAIKDIPGTMPCEDMREILRDNDGKLSTTRCDCRTMHHSIHCAVNEGTHPDEGHCIHFDRIAEYYVNEMGLGSWRTWEEVLENLNELDKSPIYHMVGNSRNVSFICNCCSCCCNILRPFKITKGYSIKDILAPSRFLCGVEAERCNGCKICVKKCPFGAIEIKDGKARVKADECLGCGACVINCPEEALKLKLVRPPEHIPELCLQWVETWILEEEPTYL